jgi:hypothetical protein
MFHANWRYVEYVYQLLCNTEFQGNECLNILDVSLAFEGYCDATDFAEVFSFFELSVQFIRESTLDDGVLSSIGEVESRSEGTFKNGKPEYRC